MLRNVRRPNTVRSKYSPSKQPVLEMNFFRFRGNNPCFMANEKYCLICAIFSVYNEQYQHIYSCLNQFKVCATFVIKTDTRIPGGGVGRVVAVVVREHGTQGAGTGNDSLFSPNASLSPSD